MRLGMRLGLPFMLLVAAWPIGTAVGQELPSATTARVEDAVMMHLRRGRIARDLGRWSEAEGAFKAALGATEQARTPEALRAEILGGLGLAELGLKKYRDAAEHLAESLSSGTVLPNTALQRRLEQGQRSAEEHVARLYVGVNPPDAELLVDDKAVGKRTSAHELYLTPGSHTIRARLSGHGHFVTTFHAVAGEARDLSIHLPAEPPAPTGKLQRVSSKPAIAARSAMVDASGGAGTTLRTGGIVLAATTATLGGVALVWSAVLTGDMADDSSDLQREDRDLGACRQNPASACSDLRDARERRDLLDRVGLISLASSGAIGAITLASFAWLPDQDKAALGAVRVVPLVGPHAGLMLQGVW